MRSQTTPLPNPAPTHNRCGYRRRLAPPPLPPTRSRIQVPLVGAADVAATLRLDLFLVLLSRLSHKPLLLPIPVGRVGRCGGRWPASPPGLFPPDPLIGLLEDSRKAACQASGRQQVPHKGPFPGPPHHSLAAQVSKGSVAVRGLAPTWGPGSGTRDPGGFPTPTWPHPGSVTLG